MDPVKTIHPPISSKAWEEAAVELRWRLWDEDFFALRADIRDFLVMPLHNQLRDSMVPPYVRQDENPLGARQGQATTFSDYYRGASDGSWDGIDWIEQPELSLRYDYEIFEHPALGGWR